MTAVVVNLGSPEAPSYQLALQSTALGDVPLQLNDGTNNLLGTLTAGADGSYTVNGQPPGGITTDSSTVTVAPGLNVNLLAAGFHHGYRFFQSQLGFERAVIIRHRL